jgi:hypothetical protein
LCRPSDHDAIGEKSLEISFAAAGLIRLAELQASTMGGQNTRLN